MTESRPRVLVLSYAYPPLAAPESWLAAKAVRSLQLVGVDVEVVRATPAWWHSYDEGLVSYAHGAATAVHAVKTPAWLPALQPIAAARQFPDAMRGLQRRAVAQIERIDVSRFDALVTWSQWHSAHLVGRVIKRRNSGLRWLAHFSDPWVENPLQPRNRVALAVNRRLERSVLALADVLEFTTIEARDLTMSAYPEDWGCRTTVVPHVFDPDLYGDDDVDTRSLVVRYVGSFYGQRRPDGLFAGLAWLLRQSRAALDGVTVEIVGDVEASMLQTPLARSLPAGLVQVKPFVPYVESLRLMRGAGVLLLVDAPATTNVFLASKLVDYVGACRPVVGITPPGSASELVRSLGGWIGDPLSPAAVADALAHGIEAARRGARSWGEPEARKPYELERVGAARLASLDGLPG